MDGDIIRVKLSELVKAYFDTQSESMPSNSKNDALYIEMDLGFKSMPLYPVVLTFKEDLTKPLVPIKTENFEASNRFTVVIGINKESNLVEDIEFV